MGKVKRGLCVNGAVRGCMLGLGFLAALYQAVPVQAAAESQGPPVLEASESRIEQVYANLPEVTVYGSGLSREALETGEGYLAQEKLTLKEVVPFRESGEGIAYYVLLDVSGSIPRSYFRAVKDGIGQLQQQLEERDKLVLCTFGEEVVLAADGSQTREELAQVLEALENRDQRTLLFEAIDRVADLADQEQECSRKVLAVVSDGEDIAVGQKLAQEAQATLREKGLPVYAFCIRDTAAEHINTFGEFARTSGGRLITFWPEEGAQVLTQLASDLTGDLTVRYQAATNQVSNKEEIFSLKFADGNVLTKPVWNNRWIPDTQAPSLESGTAAGARQIRVTFSEPVDGLELAANYHLAVDGEPVGVTGVSCDSTTRQSATLSLAEPLKNGTYVLECAGITDLSMEKNPVANPLQIQIAGIQEPETEAIQETGTEALQRGSMDYTGVLFLIFAALVALIILVVVKSRKKKEPAPEAEPMVSPSSQPAEPVVMEDGGFRQHVAVTAQRMPLEVWISKDGTGTRKTTWELGSSLIVGRSSICDVQVEDPEMSRQHFCLERNQDQVYLSDLGSTNGTAVNGIRIHEKRRLESGSLIEAGSMKITVRW